MLLCRAPYKRYGLQRAEFSVCRLNLLFLPNIFIFSLVLVGEFFLTMLGVFWTGLQNFLVFSTPVSNHDSQFFTLIWCYTIPITLTPNSPLLLFPRWSCWYSRCQVSMLSFRSYYGDQSSMALTISCLSVSQLHFGLVCIASTIPLHRLPLRTNWFLYSYLEVRKIKNGIVSGERNIYSDVFLSWSLGGGTWSLLLLWGYVEFIILLLESVKKWKSRRRGRLLCLVSQYFCWSFSASLNSFPFCFFRSRKMQTWSYTIQHFVM